MRGCKLASCCTIARYSSPVRGTPSSGIVPTGRIGCPNSGAPVPAAIARRLAAGVPAKLVVRSADTFFERRDARGCRTRRWASVGASLPSLLKQRSRWESTWRQQVCTLAPIPEKRVRDRAIRSLAAFVLKSAEETGLSLEPKELSKLWKGIFYCKCIRLG